MTAGQGPAVASRAAARPTSVIVVNCSRWPNFVQAVRNDALDLYAAEARVAFWDVTMAESEETLIWGQWPKPFAQHPRRFVDELLDRIEQVEEAANERLVVLMVFDRPESLSPDSGADRGTGAGVQAGAKAVKIAVAAVERLSRPMVEADPSLRSKVLWIAAFHGAESERDRRVAFDVVAPPAAGSPARLFETAVYLSSARGGNRRAGDAFTALRILIDLARDEDAARALLRAMPNNRDGRVFLLRPARVAANPSQDTRARLARLIRSTMDTAGSTVEDPAADRVGPIVTRLLERLETSQPGRIVGFTLRRPPARRRPAIPRRSMPARWSRHPSTGRRSGISTAAKGPSYARRANSQHCMTRATPISPASADPSTRTPVRTLANLRSCEVLPSIRALECPAKSNGISNAVAIICRRSSMR